MALSDFLKPLALTASVGNNMTGKDEDVRAVRVALEDLGYFDRAGLERDHEDRPLGIMTARLDEKIKTFQKDNDLKIDGILRPGGETAAALGTRVAQNNHVSPGTPPFAPPSSPPPGLPAYRREVFKGARAKEWDDFYQATENDPDLSNNERKIMRNIFAAEGGMKKNPDSSAYAGIMQGTLNNSIAKGSIPGVRKRHAGKNIEPKDLNMEDVQEVYKSYFDDVMSSARLGYARRNEGKTKSGLQLLGDLDNNIGNAVADTLFKNGGPDGSNIVQEAINEYLPKDEKISTEGGMGAKSYLALEKIASDKKTAKSFLETLAFKRMQRETESDKEKPRIYNYLLKD